MAFIIKFLMNGKYIDRYLFETGYSTKKIVIKLITIDAHESFRHS